jgi:putative phosphoribosyl transferase
VQGLTVGYFGASAGAAAALWAAAEPDADIAAVVSRCGRPDLAAPRLAAVRSPTLLIVGGHDTVVLGLNRDAQAQLRCDNQLEIIPGATHLFEELGTLQTAADLFVLNLECAITNRGERWPDPSRPFFSAPRPWPPTCSRCRASTA